MAFGHVKPHTLCSGLNPRGTASVRRCRAVDRPRLLNCGCFAFRLKPRPGGSGRSHGDRPVKMPQTDDGSRCHFASAPEVAAVESDEGQRVTRCRPLDGSEVLHADDPGADVDRPRLVADPEHGVKKHHGTNPRFPVCRNSGWRPGHGTVEPRRTTGNSDGANDRQRYVRGQTQGRGEWPRGVQHRCRGVRAKRALIAGSWSTGASGVKNTRRQAP